VIALDNTYIREDKVLGRLSAQVALNDRSAVGDRQRS